MISGYLGYLFSFLEPATLSQLPRVLGMLLRSGDLYFWLLFLVALRLSLPEVVLWVVAVLRPAALAPANAQAAPRLPLVSVLIAGRNVAETIVPTIRSALTCGYPNLEVIFADDHSSDESVLRARTMERTGRVKVFGAAAHSGKPGALNMALALARGEFIFILDADSELQHGAIQNLLSYFGDPEVGAVAANLRVRNALENWLTRFQECEYAINVSVSRLWRAQLDMLAILPGAGSMFRTGALRAMGGYDSGLGDDTDLTLRLRKLGWRLRFAPDAVVWTDVPNRLGWLMKQRARWARNMVKIRLNKHRDLIRIDRFGLSNAVVFADLFLLRVALPFLGFGGVVYYTITEPMAHPLMLSGLYWIVIFGVLVRLLVAHDLMRTPGVGRMWLAIFYPFYRLPIRIAEAFGILRELLRIKLWHPYVPRRIWERIPHW